MLLQQKMVTKRLPCHFRDTGNWAKLTLLLTILTNVIGTDLITSSSSSVTITTTIPKYNETFRLTNTSTVRIHSDSSKVNNSVESDDVYSSFSLASVRWSKLSDLYGKIFRDIDVKCSDPKKRDVDCAMVAMAEYLWKNTREEDDPAMNDIIGSGNLTALQEVVLKQLRQYETSIQLPVLENQIEESARAAFSWFSSGSNTGGGKSSFLTGFGLGFLAFGLKKLLLPIFIGAQIVKSVLIAMFLPSILGGLGKLVGKGVSTFAAASGSSGPSSANNNNVDDFDFKDNMGFETDSAAASDSVYPPSGYTYPDTTQNRFPVGTLPAAALYVPNTGSGAADLNRYPSPSTAAAAANSKISFAAPLIQNGPSHAHHGSFYNNRIQQKNQDYKVFHNIPSSSLLLTNYDPFYSPLLSRLDNVFKQLGYETEPCRERLVCAMYNNPAKFAPYSNLVSAQLSRELNELRKPSTDNPEILRFFRYMKAAKDGQDGGDCIRLYRGCTASSSAGSSTGANPPIVKTYQDINKLVQARKLSRALQ